MSLISEVKKSEIYYSEPRSTTSNCCIKPYPYYSLDHSQMPTLSHLVASLLEKTICDERWNTFDAEEKIHADAHENQKINCHRPNLNVKYFQLHIVRAEKPKLNDHKFGSFFFFFKFAKNEGQSDPCPNTLIWSGLTLLPQLFSKPSWSI